MTAVRALRCDGCGAAGPASDTANSARSDAKSIGWLTALPGGQDLCPDCNPTRGNKNSDVD